MKASQLNALKKECLNCRKCAIGGQIINGKISNVFSNMCITAKILVIGQNPGSEEVKIGRPFCGMSGKFFDKAIKEVLGIDRSLLYISNTVRCYTPNNRPPTDEEIDNCRFFLDREIEILKPVLIVTLGNPALRQITGSQGIKKYHGKIETSLRYGIGVLPMYHPSPLNTNRPDICTEFKADLKKLAEYL
jgi:DNA polymerase